MIVLTLQGNQSKFSVEGLKVLNVSPLPMIAYQRIPLGMYIEPQRGQKVINITPHLYVGVSLMSLWVTVLTALAPPLRSIKVSAHGCCVSQAPTLVFSERIRFKTQVDRQIKTLHCWFVWFLLLLLIIATSLFYNPVCNNMRQNITLQLTLYLLSTALFSVDSLSVYFILCNTQSVWPSITSTSVYSFYFILHPSHSVWVCPLITCSCW